MKKYYDYLRKNAAQAILLCGIMFLAVTLGASMTYWHYWNTAVEHAAQTAKVFAEDRTYENFLILQESVISLDTLSNPLTSKRVSECQDALNEIWKNEFQPKTITFTHTDADGNVIGVVRKSFAPGSRFELATPTDQIIDEICSLLS